jgi:hypothetical protein
MLRTYSIKNLLLRTIAIRRHILQVMLMVMIVMVMAFPTAGVVQASTIPTFSIVSVVPDVSVTIQTFDYPAAHTFTVRMGPFGTAAAGGTIVATTDSGAGGSFIATYSIPSNLQGSYQIAIRMDSDAGGFFAYNWFTNNVNAAPGPVVTPVPYPGTGISGIPTFSIQSVVQDDSVTIPTNNFPASLDFNVRMGQFGTTGINGIIVGTTNSGGGGVFTATYSIPDTLKGLRQIAIRMDSTSGGFFAFNWFWNNTTGSSGPVVTPGTTPVPVFTGIPTFTIQSVVRDNSVTILTNNFPASLDFTVRMGLFGTAGINGTVVGTTNSGGGGAFTATYSVPASLQGLQKIAIRLDSTSGGFFAYNWFWNNTTTNDPGPSVTPTPTPVPMSGIPTFSIQSVVSDTTVTVITNNFPANLDFTVRMGQFGTAGIGGSVIGSTNSGAGGVFTATYNIPSSLQGKDRIAIRMDATSGGFFAYNWFWNNSTE